MSREFGGIRLKLESFEDIIERFNWKWNFKGNHEHVLAKFYKEKDYETFLQIYVDFFSFLKFANFDDKVFIESSINQLIPFITLENLLSLLKITHTY